VRAAIQRKGARLSLLLALVAPLGAGCVSRSAASPFVKKGAGFIDVGGPEDAATPARRAEFEKARRDALASRAAVKPSAPPSIEGRDAALGAALAAHRQAPSVTTHLRVAEAYQRVGVHDLALDHYTDALKLEPRHIGALDGRARLWRDAGLLMPALGDAHRARYFAPKSAGVRNTLGTILERRGLCREALAEYQEAVRLQPDAAWAQQNVTRLTDTCGETP
jgi:tetratricopeptide (TPR) repeat protein